MNHSRGSLQRITPEDQPTDHIITPHLTVWSSPPSPTPCPALPCPQFHFPRPAGWRTLAAPRWQLWQLQLSSCLRIVYCPETITDRRGARLGSALHVTHTSLPGSVFAFTVIAKTTKPVQSVKVSLARCMAVAYFDNEAVGYDNQPQNDRIKSKSPSHIFDIEILRGGSIHCVSEPRSMVQHHPGQPTLCETTLYWPPPVSNAS